MTHKEYFNEDLTFSYIDREFEDGDFDYLSIYYWDYILQLFPSCYAEHVSNVQRNIETIHLEEFETYCVPLKHYILNRVSQLFLTIWFLMLR